MAICHKCKAENRPEAAFCSRCGAILLVQPTTTIPEPAELTSTKPEPPEAGPILPVAIEPGPDATVASPPAREAPIPPKPVEGPITPPGYSSRPEGSIIGDRFRCIALVYLDEHEFHYTVSEICEPGSACTRICSNPDCRTIHPPIETERENFCTQCGSPLEQDSPLLFLREADNDRFGYLEEIIDLHLVHPCVHPPIITFKQELPGSVRFYLVTPYSEELPSHPEVIRVLEWGRRLAEGLDYLHAHGVVLGEELDPSNFGMIEDRIVWRNFSGVRVLPMLADREKINDFRLLALSLYSWMTGKASYSTDPTLSPGLNELFHRALVGEGFTRGAELANQIGSIIKAGILPVNIDYLVGRRTHPGEMRSRNEDSLVCVALSRMLRGISQPAGLFAVADGMGGHATGELASSLAIQAVTQKAFSEIISLRELASDEYNLWLRQAVQAANLAVFESRQNAGSDMGSTLVCALLLGGQAYLAHLGDSRAYLIREGTIRCLTTDHSLVQHLVDTGQISPADARNHPQRNVIYRSLGDKPHVEAEMSTQNLLVNDKLLLCSDGLSGMLDDPTIQKIILEAGSPQEACDHLIEASNQAGGADNTTVILIEVIPA